MESVDRGEGPEVGGYEDVVDSEEERVKGVALFDVCDIECVGTVVVTVELGVIG